MDQKQINVIQMESAETTTQQHENKDMLYVAPFCQLMC